MAQNVSKPPYIHKHRFQFTVRALLVAILFVACATYWLIQYNKVCNARWKFEGVQAGFEAGVETYDTVVAASENLCRVEEQTPFADNVRARALNVARISEVVENFRYSIEYGDGLMGAGTDDEVQTVYARLHKLEKNLRDAQQQLHAAQE